MFEPSSDPPAGLLAVPLAGRRIGAPDAGLVIVEWRDWGGGADPPRYIAPLHIHHEDDEAWYVVEGELRVRMGEEDFAVPAGGAVLVPRGTPHTYWNPRPGPTRYVLVMTPRIERLIAALHDLASRPRSCSKRPSASIAASTWGGRREPPRMRRVTIDPGIFKAYDIRGRYGDQIDGAVAEQIGRGFARVLGELAGKPTDELRVGLGRDMRLTAPELAGRYRDGILAEGADVVDAGQVGTEMLYYLVGSRELDGGLMCTASHNPAAYTGAKLVREGAIPLSGDAGIEDIRRTVEAGMGAAPGGGQATEVEIYEEFRAAALGFVDPEKIGGLKVVLDGGNGMAGPMLGPLLRGLDLDLIETYWTPDGNFPGHEPNPLLPENRRLIIERVRAEGADLGIAWDGDADRCFFIDETGEFIDGDFLTALLAESLLGKREPGETILYDVRASRAVPDTVERAGGVAHVNRVGHAFFKTRMRAEGSLFGGEVSGHYYFRDFYCADSGTLPALLMLELLSSSGRPLSELLAPYHSRYFISGEVNSEVADPPDRIEAISAHYDDARQDRLDGISIDYDDWHFNVRPSNTEPLLRLCLESLVSREDMERRRDEVLALIRA